VRLGTRSSSWKIERIGNKRRPRETIRMSPVLRVRESCGEAA
ncbi:LacI family transcriptional regulator, partial [Rhizobium ruizarguesonis]